MPVRREGGSVGGVWFLAVEQGMAGILNTETKHKGKLVSCLPPKINNENPTHTGLRDVQEERSSQLSSTRSISLSTTTCEDERKIKSDCRLRVEREPAGDSRFDFNYNLFPLLCEIN